MRTLISAFMMFVAVGWAQPPGDKPPTILIAYYSSQGHTRAMAEAVARGASAVPGAGVRIKLVADVAEKDLLDADAIIVGSPVYNANVAPQVQEFINRWPFRGAPMRDKIGGAFVTGGGISTGEELVQLSILHSMLVFGMIVVGGPEWTSAFGASAVVEEGPFKHSGGATVDSLFLSKGEALGKRVASLATRLKGDRR
jgi:NAD(P)H dehydrogenase (quinone)